IGEECTGFVGFSTDYPTTYRLYCLMQNPAYRMQATTKGYYQSAYPDYYLGHGMPEPPIPPVHQADLRWKSGSQWDKTSSNFVSFDLTTTSSYADGKEVMFDISGDNANEIELTTDIAPSKLWAMNPKDKDYVLTGSGKLTGEMELIKSMYGTFTLNGDHTYTGRTIISEGSLEVNGSLAGPVDLRAKGTLMGNAVLNGGITLNEGLNIEGGRLSPGQALEKGKLGKIIINSDVVMAGKVNVAISIIPDDALVNDSLVINGNLALSGKNRIVIQTLSDKLAEGTYSLITWTGDLTGGVNNFEIAGLSGQPMDLVIEEKTLKLVVHAVRSAGEVTWTGAYNGNWDYKTKNFLSAALEDAFVPGDAITFNDDAVNKTITITETMPVKGLIFANDTNYTLKGTGFISGEGGLTKTGTGKLSLLTAENTFTGNLYIADGTLEVASLTNAGLPSSIGLTAGSSDHKWTMKDAVLQTAGQMATDRNLEIQGKLTVNNPTTNNSVLISGKITGTGAVLEQTGKGGLTLQGTNTLSEVIVSDGLLLLGSVEANSKSLGNAKVTLKGGTFRLFDVNSSSTVGPFKNEIHVPEGCSALWDLPMRWQFTNKLTGNGTLTVNAPYVRSDFNGDWSAFEGVIKFTGSDIRLNNATARNLPKAEVNVGSGVSLYVASNGGKEVTTKTTFTFGALSGAGTVSGYHNLIVGSRNTNTAFTGVITSGSGKLTKKGTGSLTLSGANLYTGGTAIDEGQLIVTNASASATGTGTVNVNNGGILMGSGLVSGATMVNAGATLTAGTKEKEIKTLTFGSNLTMKQGSIVVVETRVTDCDKFTVGGNLTLAGTLQMEKLSGSYANGRTFKIFTVTGTITGQFDEILPAKPEDGLVWDTTKLYTEGILGVVTDPTALDEVEASINVYPTRVEDVLNISFDNPDGERIELLNQLGDVKQVREMVSGVSEYELNMTAYSPGVYFVRIFTQGKPIVYKVVKL
ncbi:autotransporter-associated beta strand repeat-containing protein, partial [Bacteroidales bacterium OttesenSCG-928-J19]|nr:autotransporter-associated beta strand repeat-containing protein [Bacteroidales bacterium OttesenSCG-928-J19]